jgi:type IV secretion system protein VirB6
MPRLKRDKQNEKKKASNQKHESNHHRWALNSIQSMSYLVDFETDINRVFTAPTGPISSAMNGVYAFSSAAFVVGFAIWIAIIAYDVAFGRTEDGLQHILSKMGKIFFTGMLAFYGWLWFIDLANNVQQAFVFALSGGTSTTVASAVELNLLTPLDKILVNLKNGYSQASQAFSIARPGEMTFAFGNYLDFRAGHFILWLLASGLGIVTIGMYLVSFAAFQILLAVGPFFILAGAFPITHRFTETWVGAILTASLAMGFTALLVLLTATLLGLSVLVVSTDSVAAVAAAIQTGATTTLRAFLAKAGFALLLIYLYYKIFDIAASLGGGINMGSNLARGTRNLARDVAGAAKAAWKPGLNSQSPAFSAGTNTITSRSSPSATASRMSSAISRAAAAGSAAFGTGLGAGFGAGAQATRSIGKFAYNRLSSVFRR